MAIIEVPGNTGSFLIGCIRFYEDLLNDIKICKRKGMALQEEIQCCFEIATNYAGKLAADVSVYSFEPGTDEVLFFKKIKPLFTSEAEYYTYCYHADLFKQTIEDNCPMELEIFYRRQLQRRPKFSREHAVFYSYMENGRTEHDTDWFKRLPDNPSSSTYDKQLASYGAILKFEEFIEQELRAIGADSSISQNEESKNV